MHVLLFTGFTWQFDHNPTSFFIRFSRFAQVAIIDYDYVQFLCHAISICYSSIDSIPHPKQEKRWTKTCFFPLYPSVPYNHYLLLNLLFAHYLKNQHLPFFSSSSQYFPHWKLLVFFFKCQCVLNFFVYTMILSNAHPFRIDESWWNGFISDDLISFSLTFSLYLFLPHIIFTGSCTNA